MREFALGYARQHRFLGELALVLRILLVLASFLLASAAFGAGPYGTIRVGAWKGGAYTDDKTNSFSHCAAATPYLSGVTLIVGQNKSGEWLLGFTSEKFNLTAGETFPIDVTFDAQSQFHLFGTVAGQRLVVTTLPGSAVISQFRKAQIMTAVAKGATFQFKLTSTGQLLPTIANCVTKTLADGVASAGNFAPPPKALPPKPEIKNAAVTSESPKSTSSETADINGTGFVVSADGHIVTNNHVISACAGNIRGNLPGEGEVVLRVVSTDETNDLALLQAPRKFTNIATIRNSGARSGDPVIAIGYPYHGLLTSDFTVTTGIVSSLSGLLNNTRFLQITAAVQPGNSGGPLLDSSGSVIGVVAAKINAIKFAKVTGDLPENINFAIKTGSLRDFLDNSVVKYQTTESKVDLKTAEIAQNARSYTLLVSCVAKKN